MDLAAGFSTVTRQIPQQQPPYGTFTPNLRTRTALDELNAIDPDVFIARFRQKIADFGCKYIYVESDDDSCTADYGPLMFRPDDGRNFVNEIHVTCGKSGAPRDTAVITKSEDHEGAHAVQLSNCFDQWFTTFNLATAADLDVEEAIIAEWLDEIDAYGSDIMLATLRARQNPHMREATQNHLISVDRFEQICAESPTLALAVRRAGMEVLSKKKFIDRDGISHGPSYFEHYGERMIDAYQSTNLFDKNLTYYQFARLSEHAVKIGDTLDLGIYRPDFKEFVAELRSKITPNMRERIQAVRQRFGYQSAEQLPTTVEVTAMAGQTPEQLIESSKTYNWKEIKSGPAQYYAPLPVVEVAEPVAA